MLAVRGTAGRLFVATLLTLCVVISALELSGRWDRSLQDADDEAGFVAIVLCVGVALSTAGSLIAHIRTSRATSGDRLASDTIAPYRRADPRLFLFVSSSSPPLPLRI